MNNDIIYGWHFLSPAGTAYGGYRPPAVGVWEPPIDHPSPCTRGYLGSPTILKALVYANGPILGRCEFRGVVWDADGTRFAARERRCVARVDASAWLRLAACRFAGEALRDAGVTDKRSHNAIAVSRRYALGQATADELASAAASAAYAAAYAASAANAAAYAAAYAASAAASASAAYAAASAASAASVSAYAYAANAAARESWLESAALDLDCAPEWTGTEGGR